MIRDEAEAVRDACAKRRVLQRMINTMEIAATETEILRIYPDMRHRIGFRPKLAIRRLLARKRAFPNVFIIGIQKCGTTSLEKYLSEHPMILPSYYKEMKYFDLFHFKSPGWYLAHFPFQKQLSGGKITIDATPDYIFYPKAAQQIKALMPDARFLVVVRDPVDRAFSHYLYSKRRGYEDLPFMAALENEEIRIEKEREMLVKEGSGFAWRYRENSYKQRSLYCQQLRHWFRFFPKDRFMIIDAEKLKNNRQAAYDEILTFLNLPPHALGSTREYNKAPGDEKKMTEAEEDYLKAFYKEANAQLFQLLGREFDWKRP
jgi:hypothetical protein